MLRLAHYALTPDQQSQLGIFLDMDRPHVEHIMRHSQDVLKCTFDILDAWRCGSKITVAMYEQLNAAYIDIKRPDIAECVCSGECVAEITLIVLSILFNTALHLVITIY